MMVRICSGLLVFAFCHVVQAEVRVIPGTPFDSELYQWQQQRRDMIALEKVRQSAYHVDILKRLVVKRSAFPTHISLAQGRLTTIIFTKNGERLFPQSIIIGDPKRLHVTSGAQTEGAISIQPLSDYVTTDIVVHLPGRDPWLINLSSSDKQAHSLVELQDINLKN